MDSPVISSNVREFVKFKNHYIRFYSQEIRLNGILYNRQPGGLVFSAL